MTFNQILDRERLNLAPEAATVKEYFPHDVCPGCGKPSVPLEGVPDQTGRGCGQCGREWFEDMSRPAATEPENKPQGTHTAV